MSKEDKLKILETEFGITMNEKMRGEVSQMCNLSEYFIQRGIEQGIEQMEILIQHLIINSRSDEIERAVTDKEFQKQLFEEFGI